MKFKEGDIVHRNGLFINDSYIFLGESTDYYFIKSVATNYNCSTVTVIKKTIEGLLTADEYKERKKDQEKKQTLRKIEFYKEEIEKVKSKLHGI